MKDVYRLANLSKIEIKLLNLIEKEPLLASEIGKKLSIPRATLDRILSQLFARRFVSRKKRGKRFIYKSVSTEEVLSEYGLIPANELSAGVVVYEGKEALFELTSKFVKLHAKKRVRVLQTKQTWDFWTTHLTKEQNSEINTLLKRERVINEGIFSEALLKEYHKAFFGTYSKRPSTVHVLPEQYAKFATDITVTDKELYVMNWKDEVGIEITNKDTVEAFNQIFNFINENTESTNIYELTK
jgi:hypothetical protein